MVAPSSKSLTLEALVSENQLSQAWRATNRITGRPCFVKIPNDNSALDPQTQKALLKDSFTFQRTIKNRAVLRAANRHIENGHVFIEYPYVDDSRWQELTYETFHRQSMAVLPRICLIVDHLHDLGLVHGDLKLANFLIVNSSADPALLLVDLDFLCRANSHPRANVFGTPDHIAPEIRANDRILIQSDNYSLGVSLRKFVSWLSGQGDRKPTVALDRLRGLADRLTHSDPLLRPRVLTSALHDAGLLSRSEYETSLKTLLAMTLLSRFRTASHRQLVDARKLGQFLCEQSRIMGLHADLIEELAAGLKIAKLSTFRIFRNLVATGKVERHADYWHLGVEDKELSRAYDQLEAQHTASGEGQAPRRRKSRASAERIQQAQQHRENGKVQRPFLLLKQIIETWDKKPADSDDATRESVLREIGELAAGLGRQTDVLKYYDQLLELSRRQSKVDLEILYQVASLRAAQREYDRAGGMIDDGRRQAEAVGDPESVARFERLRAYALHLQGDVDAAEEILRSVLATAPRGRALVMTLYTLGVVKHSRGDLAASLADLSEAFRIAQEEGVLSSCISVISMLAWLCGETGAYEQTLEYGKLAYRNVDRPIDALRLPYVCSALAVANTYLAEYPKAEYWLQKYLDLKPLANNRLYLLIYHSNAGWLLLNRGDLFGAQQEWHKAIEVADASTAQANIGRVYHNLSQAAYQQGDHARCRDYLTSARKMFEKAKDRVSLARVAGSELINDHYNREQQPRQRWLDVLSALVEHHSHTEAGICLFHMLVSEDGLHDPSSLPDLEALKKMMRRSAVPLFRALNCLYRTQENQSTTPQETSSALKEAFRILNASGGKFLAMLAARRVAHCYLEASKPKLAKKFLLQAQRLAHALENRRYAEQLAEQLRSVSPKTDSQERLIQSVLGISHTLGDISDHRQALARLVQFAVDQSGAERGVLFVTRRDSEDLQVAAFVNVDEESLRDIENFSTTIPKSAVKEMGPVVIEDALSDKRTREYKSVIYHNILSVICVPIVHGDDPLGVLYLDHHSIPALFDEEDVTYVRAIANFIAVAMSTIREYRRVSIAHDQLLRDLNRLGDQYSFITQDACLLGLFERLPQIAKTSAPVLLYGPSGTGKEILCRMIHNNSLRAKGPLVKLNCAAIPDTLIESELFGVAKNTATGVSEREGKFSAADGGTLYLDEIGDMPLRVQAKVLRVLEYQQFERVGSNRTIHTDIRFVYATNRDLMELVKRAKFREDLYYRINTIIVEIAPLNERRQDLPLLIEHFTRIFSAGRQPPRMSREALEVMMTYDWPGNAREVRNVVERCCILYPGQTVQAGMLPKEMQRRGQVWLQSKELAEKMDKDRILEALKACSFNQSKAARQLGMPLSTMRRRMSKYGIRRA